MVKVAQIAILCVSLVVGIADAQTLSVEDRMAVLDAQLVILRKEAEVKKALRESAGASVAGMPTVMSVNIVGGQRTVLLQLPNGTEEHFREGDEVQNDYRISSIGLKKVLVSIARGKKTAYMTLASTSLQNSASLNDPNRNAQSIPNQMLPEPPMVTVPSLKSILPLPSQVNSVQSATGAKPAK